MERILLTFLLGVSLSPGADTTVSSIRTISGGESTTFFLPESKTWVLALRSAAKPEINYKYYALGRLIANDTCSDCYGGSLWVPFVTITEKGIKRYDSHTEWFQGDIGSSQARNLSITTKSHPPVELQELPLPLKNYEIVEMPFEGSVHISLPDKEEVWLALWNDQKDGVNIHFNLYDETGIVEGTFSGIVEEGWLIIRIYENKIIYGGNLHDLSEHGLKRRLLELHNPNSLKYQLFSMPFEPTGTKEQTDTDESADTNLNLILIIVVVSLALLVAASFLAYRFCWKKREEELREGPPRVTTDNDYSKPVTTSGGVIRPNSSHDSENSLYGAGIVNHCEVTRQNSAHDSENSVYGVTLRERPQQETKSRDLCEK